MNPLIADLHIHSGYSRATSKDMNVVTMAAWAKRKGIHLLGTGDFTHPGYFEQLQKCLVPAADGLFTERQNPEVFYMLSAEISSIYSFKGKVRKIHSLVYAPSMDAAEKINKALQNRGANISSDGRPIVGIPAKDLLQIVLDISEDCLFVPAHAWTPWFSIFGSKSGFDSIEECFEEYTPYVYAIETGLSSDPEMNWRLSALDSITLLSNSDAHSPSKLGREANVFKCPMDYYEIAEVIRRKDRERFLYTIEFFPEEGKYHVDGHRACGVSFSPEETKQLNAECPVCHKPLTVGVMSRVAALADRPEGFVPDNAVPAKHLVPLQEIIAATVKKGVNTKTVQGIYTAATDEHTEFEILLDLTDSDLTELMDERIARAVMKVRAGDIHVVPGYDGVFGEVSIAQD